MEWILWISLACAAVAVLMLAVKIHLMGKAAREIAQGFAEKLKEDTNTLIDLSSRDRSMRALASAVNRELRRLRALRRRYQQGDMELKAAVTNISHDLSRRQTICILSGAGQSFFGSLRKSFSAIALSSQIQRAWRRNPWI